MKMPEKAFVSAALAVLALAANAVEVKSPANPKPWEKTAATELQTYLKKCLGNCAFTAGGVAEPTFYVGDTDFAAQKGLTSDKLKDEEWVVKQFGKDVVVNGGGTRGCVYAVYHFLEDMMDVRFWSESEEDVPGPFARTFKKLDLRGQPFFFYRGLYRCSRPSSTPKFAIKRRLNYNGTVKIPAEFGGGRDFGPPHLTHTFDFYFPTSKYLATHPEWYSLRDGKRVGGQFTGQLCLSNPELRKVFKEKVFESIRQGEADAKKRGVPAPAFYAVVQNDNGKDCQCPACAALIEKYGRSGYMVQFVNEIAEAVAKTHPDIYILMAAYAGTLNPPKDGIRPAKNVVVQYATTQANRAVSIHDESNKTTRDHVLNWEKACDHMALWGYATTFQNAEGFPLPSEYYYSDAYRFWADNKFLGGMLQHDGGMDATVPKAVAPYFVDYYDLKYYFEARLFEDPYLDMNALIKDATKRYFGPAAPQMLAVRERLLSCAKQRHANIKWFAEPLEFTAFIHREDMEAIAQFYADAERAVANDATHLRRVRKVKRGFDHMMKRRANTLHREGDRYVTTPDEFVLKSNPTYMRVVDDAEAPGGKTMQIAFDSASEATQKYLTLPFQVELHDNAIGKSPFRKTLMPKNGSGYAWYDLGKMKFNESEFIFFTRAWNLHAEVGFSEIAGDGREYDVRALIKFEGPQYRPDTLGSNTISIARVEYLPCPAQTLNLLPRPREVTLAAGTCAKMTVREATDGTLPSEGYRLTVGPDGATVRAADAAGFFYARQTLAQLPRPWPCCEISDAPAFSWRGVMVDESRHFFGKEAILRLLDAMALNKLNRFHWHLTDDQGWRIEIPEFPKLTQCGSVRARSLRRGVFQDAPEKVRAEDLTDVSTGRQFYTVDDIRAVVDYAAKRNITVVPEVDLPGHMVAALSSYPEYACVPENVAGRGPRIAHGVSEDVLCIGNEAAVAFTEKVLAAVARLFPGPYVHIGGDECPCVRWEKCPKCRARVAAERLDSPRQLQAWFIARVSAGLGRLGKRAVCWNDAILSGAIPTNVVAMCWRYGGNEEECGRIYAPGVLADGRSAVMCPHDWTYANYSAGLPGDPFTYYGKTVNSLERFFSFNPVAGVPVRQWAQVLGGQVCCWSGTVYDPGELEWKLWPRTAAAAEALWCGLHGTTYRDFRGRLEAQRTRLKALGVVVAPLVENGYNTVANK